MDNQRLHTAHSDKKDEFYTKYETIEDELKHYWAHLRGKIVYCNCDRPKTSNFWKYFKKHFEEIGIRELWSTYYSESGRPYYSILTYVNGKLKTSRKKLRGNGDYRSAECVEILKQSDVVVTNPPFSLAKHFVPMMYQYGKDFLILANQNILTFKGIHEFIANGSLRRGRTIDSGDVEFEIPSDYELIGSAIERDGKKYAKVTGIRWFTNIDYGWYPEPMSFNSKYWNLKYNSTLSKALWTRYGRKSYPRYDNAEAIEVPYTAAIPKNYDGVMGVPLTFFDKYNPSQFEIVGIRKGTDGKDLRINGVTPYFRFLIKFRQPAAAA